jgi:pimeloyl-ACP methyl ester carboxylesterase
MAVNPQHFSSIDGLRVHFRLRGSGEPLVLLHGWGQTSLGFAGVMPALEKQFRVLAPDLPGFGFSESPPAAWGSTEYAGVVASLIKNAGFERADVLGHSFGGKVAVALAASQPELVRRLVLVAAPVVRLPQVDGVRSRARGYKVARRLAALVPPPLQDRILGWARDRYGSEDYKAAGELRSTLVKVVNEDWRTELRSLRSPVLLVYGERDTDVPVAVAREALAEAPGAELVVIEGAGHFPFLDDRERFVDAVTTFLTAAEAPSVA